MTRMMCITRWAAAAALWAAGTTAAHAAVNATLQIQSRAGLVPTGRVDLSLELSAPPGAGMGVTVSGVTATLGGVSQPLPNGDRIRLRAAPLLTNGVTLQYDVRSSFSNPGVDWCAPSGAALPGPIAATFNDPGNPGITSNAYYFNSYTAAKNMPADPGDISACQQVKRRISISPALLTSPPPGTNKGRHPLDLVLVLDKSGSMSSKPPGDPGNPLSRYLVMKNAVERLVAIYEQVDPQVNDRIGLVFFETDVIAESFSGSPFLARGTNPPGPTHAWADIVTRVGARGPGSSTAIGKGVQRALNDWGAIAANAKNDLAIVLMTDGQQNVSPLVEKEAATGIWKLDDLATPAGAIPLSTYGVPIFAIGFGTPGAVDKELLDGISAQTVGTAQTAVTGDGLDDAFANTLVTALKGNTLSRLAKVNGLWQPPNPVATPIKVQIDGSVRRATFVLGWPGRRGSFDLLLQAPGGSTTPVPFVARYEGERFIVASVDLPSSGPAGEWTAFVRPRDLSRATPFTLDVLATDGRLKYALDIVNPTPGTGDALLLRAQLGFDGAPLTGISGVSVEPAVPSEGLGNILAASTVTGTNSGNPDAQNAYQQKVKALEDTAGLLDRIEPKPTGSAIVLRDDGTNGDQTAGDGIYTVRINDTRKPGLYRLQVALQWDDPRTGKITRLETLEREVKVVADPANTQVQIVAATANAYTLSITPRDRFRNHMGPGYDPRVLVSVTGGTITRSVSDPGVNGTYVVEVTATTPGTPPRATIQVDGVTVRTDMPVVPGGGGAGGTGGRYAVWGGLGVAVPHGSFSNTHKTGLALALGVEREITGDLSLEATLGTHRFAGKGAAPDIDATVLGLNGKWYFTPQPMRFFATAGIGVYDFSPGSTRGGASAGVGAQFQLTSQWSLEARYGLHSVISNSPFSTHSTLLLAARYAF